MEQEISESDIEDTKKGEEGFGHKQITDYPYDSVHPPEREDFYNDVERANNIKIIQAGDYYFHFHQGCLVGISPNLDVQYEMPVNYYGDEYYVEKHKKLSHEKVQYLAGTHYLVQIPGHNNREWLLISITFEGTKKKPRSINYSNFANIELLADFKPPIPDDLVGDQIRVLQQNHIFLFTEKETQLMRVILRRNSVQIVRIIDSNPGDLNNNTEGIGRPVYILTAKYMFLNDRLAPGRVTLELMNDWISRPITLNQTQLQVNNAQGWMNIVKKLYAEHSDGFDIGFEFFSTEQSPDREEQYQAKFIRNESDVKREEENRLVFRVESLNFQTLNPISKRLINDSERNEHLLPKPHKPFMEMMMGFLD